LKTFRLDEGLRLRSRGSDRYHRAHELVLPGHEPLTLFGDRRSMPDGRPSPAGTYYMDEDGPAGYFWHMPDQVLIRSELLVSKDARRPNISDHLPVLFEFSGSVWTEVSP
jgi:hypothetical protein